MKNIVDNDLYLKMSRCHPLDLGEANFDDWRLPQKALVGAAYDLAPWWKLVGEARWINFRRSFARHLTVPSDGLFPLPFPLKYEDQWVFIAGSEFKLAPRWTLGLGYNHATNNIPQNRLCPLAPQTIRHHLSAGLRYEHDRWWVGGGYVYGFKSKQENPGISALPLGADYSFASIEHAQQSLFVGFGFKW